MYYQYFGLREAPFSIAVDPRYLFMSQRHQDALAHLLYGVNTGGGFILLTGEVGTGKTTIIRSVLERLPANTDLALVFNPALNAEQLLAATCDELGVEYRADPLDLKQLSDNLHRFLLANHARGRNTVLLIDEAQHLQRDVLEQVRLLTNLETHNKKLLQIILVGQPELQDMLAQRELRQLSQRITARFQLKPLNLAESGAYIRHRLEVAGLPASQTLFPPAVVREVHRLSGGIPRLINLLCDRALLGTYGRHRQQVDKAMLKLAAAEVLGDSELESSKSRLWPWVAVLVLAVLLTGGWLWQSALLPSQLLPQGRVLAVEHNVVDQAAIPATEPAVVSEPSTAAVKPVAARAWYREQSAATTALLAYLELPVTLRDCQPEQSWRCQREQVISWDAVEQINRPGVIGLLTPAKQQRYAVLLALDSEQALVLMASQGTPQTISLSELGPLWTGEYSYFWRAPPGYLQPLSLGSNGPAVSWLAQQFAELDRQSQPLAVDQFNAALQTRTVLFQRQQGLNDDGVAGQQTLMKLNEQQAGTLTLAMPAAMEGN